MKSRLLLVLALVAFMAAVVTGYWGVRLSQSPEPAAGASVSPPEAAPSEVTLAEGREGAMQAQGSQDDFDGSAIVVVLAENKAAYSTILEEDLIFERLQIAPPGSFAAADAVVGQKLWRDTAAGTILTESSFTVGGPLARMIRENERALAIAVNEVISNGGYLRPGDFVDVLLYLPQDDKNNDRTMQVVVPALRVLSVGSALGATLEGEPAELPVPEGDNRRSTGSGDSARTAVLAIPDAILTRFALAAEVGQLRLAVRSDDEELMRRYLDGELLDDENLDYQNIEQQLYQFEKFALRYSDDGQSGLVPSAPSGVEVFRGVNVSREQP